MLIAHKDVLSKRLSKKEVDDINAIEAAKNDQGWQYVKTHGTVFLNFVVMCI